MTFLSALLLIMQLNRFVFDILATAAAINYVQRSIDAKIDRKKKIERETKRKRMLVLIFSVVT